LLPSVSASLISAIASALASADSPAMKDRTGVSPAAVR
jgi:hypothetical protein